MAIYCMSDIHANYDLFIKMLDYIKFNEFDELYILGDIFDRGKDAYHVYKYVMDHDNIHMLMGNHEHMALTALQFKGVDWMLWYHRNGGYYTYESFIKHLGDNEEYINNEIIAFCKQLPLYQEIEVSNQKYILVHAGIAHDVPLSKQEADTVLWIRELFYDFPTNIGDSIVIFGHTPTYYLSDDKNTKIWIDPKYRDKICIDGCCYAKKGHLNCLRLDDLQAFSISSDGMDIKDSYNIENKIHR